MMVGTHAAKILGISSKAYRHRYPAALMTAPECVDWFREEAIRNGAGPGMYGGPLRCPRGHWLAHKDGRMPSGRCCRCEDERKRQWRAAKREAGGRKLCECGCGTEIYALTTNMEPKRFVRGHDKRVVRRERLCECGCGTVIHEPGRFVRGHHTRGPEMKRDSQGRFAKKILEDADGPATARDPAIPLP